MADYLFKGYENEVLEEQIESILATKVDVNRFFTTDYSLTENPGMKKVIHKYTGTGTVEDLERGEGNTEFVDAEYSSEDYEVARFQGQAKYYDDDIMTDPTLIEAKLKYLSEGMINAWTAKALAEFAKTTNEVEMVDYSLGSFAEAIANYTNIFEDQAGLYFLCNTKMIPELRKMLGDYLKYTEAYIRTGAIGDILGVPVFTSKAVPEDVIYMATNEAVTAFVKKETSVEQDRDIDKKENFVVAAKWAVIALTDERKCWKLVKAEEDPDDPDDPEDPEDPENPVGP